jgi:hypothetical protein
VGFLFFFVVVNELFVVSKATFRQKMAPTCRSGPPSLAQAGEFELTPAIPGRNPPAQKFMPDMPYQCEPPANGQSACNPEGAMKRNVQNKPQNSIDCPFLNTGAEHLIR